MLRIFTHFNLKTPRTLLCLSILSFSCVCFNTFYNAETSFQKALQIIEESPILENEALPSQAKQLLGEAIENSQLILNVC